MCVHATGHLALELEKLYHFTHTLSLSHRPCVQGSVQNEETAISIKQETAISIIKLTENISDGEIGGSFHGNRGDNDLISLGYNRSRNGVTTLSAMSKKCPLDSYFSSITLPPRRVRSLGRFESPVLFRSPLSPPPPPSNLPIPSIPFDPIGH